MKGFRQEKQKSNKHYIKDLETALANTQAALQVSNLMIKQLMNKVVALENDLGSTMGILNDFQYRTLSMLEVGNFDKVKIEEVAEQLKLKEFNKMSDKEDLEKRYINDDAGVVDENSIVIITSSTPDLQEDQGIFRSKFPMSECVSPNLRQSLLGAKVGDVISSDIFNVKHQITVLGLRKQTQSESQSNQVPTQE